MSEEPIKFRCYRCNKLLGVPGRRAGAVVACPQCQTELQVPVPGQGDDPPASAQTASESAATGPFASSTTGEEALGPKLPPELAALRPEDIRVEAEFVNLVVDLAPVRPAPAPREPEPVLSVEAGRRSTDREHAPVAPTAEAFSVSPGIAPVIPAINLDSPSLVPRELSPRAAREVVLSPTVVLAWSLLVLFAVPLAFLAGLLTGHFVWK